MKEIIKLTNEYASNLNVLFFNFDAKLAAYYDMFDFIFNDCLVSDDLAIAQREYFEIIDIVFIKIDNTFRFKTYEALKSFIHSLRKKNELLPVYIIKENITDPAVLEIMIQCYCLDGFVPAPFKRDDIYRFLFRILKRIITFKELESYINTLEEQLNNSIDSGMNKIYLLITNFLKR